MDRRRFLQIAGVAGLSLMAPVVARKAGAGSQKYEGPFFIMVNAGGGWDPTMLCDPKGGTDPKDVMQVNHSYSPDQIGKVPNSPITYAPTMIDDGNQMNPKPVITAKEFFESNHQRLMVINGIDTSTNNHDAGSRTIWSGQLADGFPSFAAMVAGNVTKSRTVPLAFLSFGGYDITAGLASLSRVGGTDSLERLAYTNKRDPNDPKTDTYHTPNTASRIAAAQEGRIRSLQGKQALPNVADSMGQLYLARLSDSGLAPFGDALRSTKLVNVPDDFPDLQAGGNLNGLEGLMRQGQLALVAFKTGVAVSANLSIGGYDTHSNHDTDQGHQLMILTRGLDYIFQQIDALGLAGQVYVIVGSDFGRTPFYNKGDGKDHWNITSMLFAGPGIPGNRVVGATDAGFKPLTVNPTTLALDPNGIRIEPKHIHMSLRKLAGITGTEADVQYGLAGDMLPLFKT